MSATASAPVAVRKRRAHVISVEVPAVLAAKAVLLDVPTEEFVQDILNKAAEDIKQQA